MQLCILCGGRATRLGEIAKTTPKCLQKINEKPLLDILIAEYKKSGFTDFVLLAGHLGDQLKKYESKDIKVIIEKSPLGTGGAIINALPHLQSQFYVVNADTFIKAESLGNFLRYSKDKSASLIFNDTHAGLFSFMREELYTVAAKQGIIPDKQYNLEKDIILYMKNMHYYVDKGKFWDIGVPKRLEEFRKYFNRPALFLDRDGTIIKHVPYITDPNDVVLVDNVMDQMKKAKAQGYYLIMISNQSGVAKGIISQNNYNKVHTRMIDLLKKEGIILDGQYICLSADNKHPDRKPNPGLLLKAAKDFNLDLSDCIFVGDRLKIDIAAGKKAGINKLYLTKDFNYF